MISTMTSRSEWGAKVRRRKPPVRVFRCSWRIAAPSPRLHPGTQDIWPDQPARYPREPRCSVVPNRLSPNDGPSYQQSGRVKDVRFPQNADAFRLPHTPAPPVAARSLTRPSNNWLPASVIETKEVHMTRVDIYTEIAELRAELRHCILTRKERRESLRRLEELLAEAERRRCEEEGA